MKQLLLSILIISFSSPVIAKQSMPDCYKLIKSGNSQVHLLTIDPAKYQMKIISAMDGVFGRERLDSIAGRVGSDIAVNAGFFEIGGDQDGMPSGGIGIDGLIYGIHAKKLATIIQNQNEVSIKPISMKIDVEINGRKFKINSVNKFARGKRVYLYSHAWGETSLTSYSDRQEFLIASDGEILNAVDHGNNNIPEKGYVLSLPLSKKISNPVHLIGKQATLSFTPNWLNNKNYSYLMGLPMLVSHGQISPDISRDEPNARTAFGITKDGHYVVAVVEHANLQDLKNMTLLEANALLKKKELWKQDLKMSELKTLLKQEAEKKSSVKGLGLKSLGQFMKDQGCIAAVNLDGGGSSSLFINGKYTNQAFGDVDENQGLQTQRALANAIVFIER